MRTHPPVGNLDPSAQDQMLRFGILASTVGLAAIVALQVVGASNAWRLAVFPLFFIGSYGVGAALLGTCGFAAMRGCRIRQAQQEPIADRTELAAVRRRGAAVLLSSTAFSALASMLLTLAH